MDKVYCMVNDSMPGLVKIGMTEYGDIRVRVRALSQATGVPTPFQCCFYIETEPGTGRELEKAVHDCMDALGFINPGKEFYSATVDEVWELFKGIAGCKNLHLVECKIKEAGKELDEGLSPEHRLCRSFFFSGQFRGTQYLYSGMPKGYIK